MPRSRAWIGDVILTALPARNISPEVAGVSRTVRVDGDVLEGAEEPADDLALRVRAARERLAHDDVAGVQEVGLREAGVHDLPDARVGDRPVDGHRRVEQVAHGSW